MMEKGKKFENGGIAFECCEICHYAINTCSSKYLECRRYPKHQYVSESSYIEQDRDSSFTRHKLRNRSDVKNYSNWHFPQVNYEDWCGEWKQKEYYHGNEVI